MNEEIVDAIYKGILERNNVKYNPNKPNQIPEEQRLLGEGVKFQRLRRVTGYLSGRGIDGMNDAKQAEVADRVINNGNSIKVEHYHNEVEYDS